MDLLKLPFSFNLGPLKMQNLSGDLVKSGLFPGASASDVLIKLNPPNSISGTNLEAKFGARDAVHKKKFGVVTPFSITDPYIFSKSWKADVSTMKTDTLEIIRLLTKKWKDMGLPVVKHEILGVDVPTDSVQDIAPHLERCIKAGFLADIYFIQTNMDLLPGFTFQRYIPAGWYSQNISGNSVPLPSDALHVMTAIAKGRRASLRSKQGMQSAQEVLLDSYDPPGTNVGWPLYYAAMSKGVDTAKARLVEYFKGSFSMWKVSTPGAYKLLKHRLAAVASLKELDPDGLTFASAVSRRARRGLKPSLWFSLSEFPQLEGQASGVVTPRIVFMFSHLYNILLNGVMPALKGTRKLIYGGFSDLKNVAKFNAFRKTQKVSSIARDTGDSLITLENDASAFDVKVSVESTDRLSLINAVYLFGSEGDVKLWEACLKKIPLAATSSAPYNVMIEKDVINKLSPVAKNVYDMLIDIRRTPILLPDINNKNNENNLLVFTGKTQLQSGTKPTGEIGSDITQAMCSLTYFRLKWYTLKDIESIGSGSAPPQSKPFFAYLGDDNTHYNVPVSWISRFDDMLSLTYSDFGIKSGVLIGDRFLMKHTHALAYRPVLARIWQQRISNENMPKHVHIYSMGVIASVDNVYGNGSLLTPKEFGYDFTVNQISEWQQEIISWVLAKLVNYMEKAVIRPTHAIDYIRAVIKKDLKKADEIKRALEKELPKALEEMKASPEYDPIGDDFIAILLRDKHSPSTAALLDVLQTTDDEDLLKLMDSFEVKLKEFYKWELETLGTRLQDYSSI